MIVKWGKKQIHSKCNRSNDINELRNIEILVTLENTELVELNHTCTCNVKYGFKAQTEPPHLQSVLFLYTGVNTFDSFPVLFSEDPIVMYTEGRGLQKEDFNITYKELAGIYRVKGKGPPSLCADIIGF